MRSFETPEAVVRGRLDVAGRVALDVGAKTPLVAGLVVGSTALRRCSERADLDLVLVAEHGAPADRFVSRTVGGLRVEVEWLERHEALAATAGEGWVWELRQGARLGCGVPVYDPDGFGASLSARAAAMAPSADRFESTLRDVYLALIALGRDEPAGRIDALRGCLDNLTLLTLLRHPRRYQKAKWALADLLHAGEDRLVEAVLAAYGARSDDADVTGDTLARASDLIAHAYERAGLPPHESILALGHAPELAEASYVSRCLDDADDLRAGGRFVEAQYVAKFAARLLAATFGTAGLTEAYRQLFDGADDNDGALLEAAIDAADALREAA